MAESRIIAIWGKGELLIGETTTTEAMPDDNKLSSVGIAENKTITLSYESGDSQELKGTGGVLVDTLEEEGKLVLEATLIEPTTIYKTLGLTNSTDAEIKEGKIRVNGHVVDKRFAFKFLPQRVGGWGIAAPVAQISFSPAGEETKGGSAKIRLTIIEGQQGYLYDRITKKAPEGGGEQETP